MNSLIDLFFKESIYKDSTNLKFKIIIIVLVILLIGSRIFNINTSTILLIVLGLFIGDTIVQNTNEFTLNTNKLIDYKLKVLQDNVDDYINKTLSSISQDKISNDDISKVQKKNNLDSLYIDATIIQFLYDSLYLNSVNQSEFYLLLKGTNGILSIRKDMEILLENIKLNRNSNIQELFEAAVKLRSECQNHIHNCIYNVLKDSKMYSFIDNTIETYTKLINRELYIMNLMIKKYQKIVGVNNNTKFTKYLETNSFDPLDNHDISVNNRDDKKLLDLYI